MSTETVTFDVVTTVAGRESARLHGYTDEGLARQVAQYAEEGHYGPIPLGYAAHVERVVAVQTRERVWG